MATDLQLALKIQALVKGLDDVAAMSSELEGLAREAGVPLPDATADLREGAREGAGDMGALRDGAQQAADGVGALGDQSDRGDERLSALSGAIGKVVTAGAALGAIGLALKSSVDEATDADTRFRKLEGVIRATGGAAGYTAEEIRAMSSDLALATLGSVQGFEDAAAALLTFRSVSGDAFGRALELSQDLASVMGGDAKSAAMQLGKALEDPEQGLSALTRSGVSFTEQQKSQIKAMAEMGDKAAAHALILDEVAKQVGGVARSMAGGLAGAQDTVAQRWEELRRAAGDAMTPAMIQYHEQLAAALEFVADNLDTVAALAKQVGIVAIAAFATRAAPAVRALSVQLVVATQSMLGLATATTTAAGAMGLLNRMVGALKFTGLFLAINAAIELSAKFLGARAAAKEAEKAIDEFLKPRAVNGPARAMEDAALAAERARFALTDVQRQMLELRQSGVAAGAALSQAFKEARLGDVEGIAELLRGLEQVRASALATGEDIDQFLAGKIRELSARDLADLGAMAELAFGRGDVAARQFSALIDGQLRETLRRAGVDASMVFDGMGAASLEAIASLDGVIGSLDRLQDRGVETGRVVESALVKAFSAADSQRAIDEIAARMKSLGLSAANTGDAISRAMRAAQARVEDLTPGIQSAEEAYRRLGIQSKAALAEQAKGLREAYDYLVQSGAAIDDQAAAWAKWADAAIAANGGVATATMQSEAAMRGYAVAVDEAGNAQIRLRQAVEASSREAEAAAAVAIQSAEDAALAQALAWDRAGRGIGNVKDRITDFHAHLTALGDGLAAHINFTRQATFGAVNGSVEAMKLFEAAAKEGAARVMNIGGVIEAYYKSMDFVIGRYAEQTQHAAAMTEALQQRIDETAGAVDRSSNSLADQIKLVEQTMDRVNLLGDQDLEPLRRALDDAKSRMRALRDEASDTLATIQDEWDRLNNNLGEIERRRAAKREAELKVQLAAAQAAGDREAIANLEKALRLLKQINAENIKAAREEEKSSRNRDSGGGTTSTGDRTGGTTRGGGSRPSGGTSAPTPTPTPTPAAAGGVHFHIGGILDVNDRATLDTLARKLKPVIGDLDRKGF